MEQTQKVDLYSGIEATRQGPPPLVIRALTHPSGMYTMAGPVSSQDKVETYVLLSALPEELRAKVVTAVQALIAGM